MKQRVLFVYAAVALLAGSTESIGDDKIDRTWRSYLESPPAAAVEMAANLRRGQTQWQPISTEMEPFSRYCKC